MSSESKFPETIAGIPPEQAEAIYGRLLASRNGVREHNKSLTKWASRINAAVSFISTEGSLVFQAMAEKAGVRNHPSVSTVVQIFDAISHPQWGKDETPQSISEIWPTDWNFDGPEQWSGDADAALNAPISDAIDALQSFAMSSKAAVAKDILAIIEKLQSALVGKVEGIKDSAGFAPRLCEVPVGHFRDFSSEQLRDLASSLGWAALDLAQDMHFANNMLRRDLRAAVYRRVCGELYGLSQLAIEPTQSNFNIKVFGGDAAA